MSLEMEDVRFSFFQKALFENNYPYVTKEGSYSQLIWSLQNGVNAGRRRKLGEIGNLDLCHPPSKKFVQATGWRPLKKCQDVEKRDLINTLPDELLLEVFRCIQGPADRYACASVCMRWLILQSHLQSKEIKQGEESMEVAKASEAGDELKRNLEGKRATDVRLALIALGTQARGGLGKLVIRGGPRQNPVKAVSNLGLSAVGICCGALKVLSLWDCPNIDDIGFSFIGKGCRQLKVLNVLNCLGFGNAGLQAIARGCPLLSNLCLEGCDKIGDEGLRAVGEHCTQLSALSVAGCKNVGDSGVVSIVSKCKMLKALKLEKLGIQDAGLITIGEHGISLLKLKLLHLEEISMEGFYLFGKNSNMKLLKHLQIVSCRGMTDRFLEVIGKTSSELKLLSLVDCKSVTECRLLAFLNDCNSLESLHLEKCALISSAAPGAASNQCISLKSLSIIHCVGVGDGCLPTLTGGSCLKELDLSGFTALTDEVLIAFLTSSGSCLSTLNLSGCVRLTNRAIAAVASFCPFVEVLTLEGCVQVSNDGLNFIAQGCQAVKELDVTKCTVGDEGVLALLAAKGPAFKTFSLSGCGLITDRCLPYIERACGNLEALNVKDCKGLSRSKLDAFESRMWRCQVCS